jgi:hypothetical protein
MPRLLAIAILSACAPALLPAAPVPLDAGKPVYYFPTQVGTKWVYDAKREVDAHGEVVTASEEKDGRLLVSVKTTDLNFADHDSTTITQYAVSKDGVFEVAYFLEDKERVQKYDPPYCWLKLPHKDGNSWKDEPHSKHVFVAKKVETVKVPAGTFEAIRVEVDTGAVSWYAPGVGIVKHQYNAIDKELKSFKLPKDKK